MTTIAITRRSVVKASAKLSGILASATRTAGMFLHRQTTLPQKAAALIKATTNLINGMTKLLKDTANLTKGNANIG